MPSFERGAYEPSDDVRVFDAADDDEQEEEGSRLPLLIVIGLLVFAAFLGFVWFAYTRGVERGREEAPRTIVAEQGPVKSAPANPGGATNPYTGLKIDQSPAPPDETGEDESAPPPPTPAGKDTAATPAISPSLAPVIRPAQNDVPKKVVAAPPPVKLVQTPPAKRVIAPPAATPPAAPAASVPASPRVATHAPAKLVAADHPPAAVQEAAPVPAKQTVPAAPAAPPAAKPAAGAFVLQIGSYKSEEEASAAWKTYQGRHPLVGGYESDIKKVDLGDKGTWYRLRVGSFADKTAAGSFCAKLKVDGGDCIPSKE